MEGDLLGTRRFAVVRDDFDQHQVSGWGRSCRYACAMWPRAPRRVTRAGRAGTAAQPGAVLQPRKTTSASPRTLPRRIPHVSR
jgi:hypothetical protein